MSIEDGKSNGASGERPESAPGSPERSLRWTEVEEMARMRRDEAVSPDHAFFNSFPKKKRDEMDAYVAQRRDTNAKRDRESKLQGRERVLADAFEWVVGRRINEFDWFGKGMRAKGTSEYDDYRNGIDMYLEKDGKPIGLAFDLTYSMNQADLAAKLSNIKNFQLDQGEPARLDHYLPLDEKKLAAVEQSDNYPIGLPKVIVGVTRDQMLNTITSYKLDKETNRGTLTGLVLLYQVKLQLAHFHRYCLVVGRKNPKVWSQVKMYERALGEINAAWEERKQELNLDEAKLLAFVQGNEFTQSLARLLDGLLPEGRP